MMGTSVTETSPFTPQHALFDDPRQGRSGALATVLDLWRVHLEQCPDCGHVHGSGGKSAGGPSRPERHIYDYTQGVPEDLYCPLCGEVFQDPSQVPCGHHYCSACVRTLLNRGAGRAACPLDGQSITRFALLPADSQLLTRVSELRIRCPVCSKEIRKADLCLHLQDPVNMVEPPEAYLGLLKQFYMSCPLSNFTVGEFNGTSSLIRFYTKLGEDMMRRFVRTTDDFIIMPDPKMGFQPHTEDDIKVLRERGGYFNAWWVHPQFRHEVWWRQPLCDDVSTSEHGLPDAAEKIDTGKTLLLEGLDCSAEPWHHSSFVHTWSGVRKPRDPRYICSVRDLRGEDLPMLETFRGAVLDFLKVNYFVEEAKVHIFAHYPSSARYSTLHFHIIFEGSEDSRYTTFAKKLERPHQLSRQFSLATLIDLLRKDPRHFETCTLSYFLGDKADLMDPISAFFGCSPHRYIRDFTFHWDPTVVGNSEQSGGVSQGAGIVVCRTGVHQNSHTNTDSRRDEVIISQVGELRRSIESLRSGVDELRTAAREAKDVKEKDVEIRVPSKRQTQSPSLPSTCTQEQMGASARQGLIWMAGGATIGAICVIAGFGIGLVAVRVVMKRA